jgi:DNA-directed RNA polymerase specialized sigma24 family protein
VLATATHLKALPGPADELESLFRDHSDRVLRAAYRITGSAVDAEDVLQTILSETGPTPGGRNARTQSGELLHRAAVNASLDLVVNVGVWGLFARGDGRVGG